LQDLTQKLQERFSITLTLLNKVMTQSFSKNFKKTFGNLEQSLAVCKSGCLLFGTKTTKLKLWFLRLTVLLKRLTKFQRTKLKGRLTFVKNILKANLKNNIMAKTAMKSYSLAEMKDKYIGRKGTKDRDQYEYELRMDILGRMIKTARQQRKLTQEQLGELVGVQKAQISKLESSANSATIDTVLKVFKALKADIHFNVTIEKQYLQLV
jgi:DNA-binding XRE family transcriptional regulator